MQNGQAGTQAGDGRQGAFVNRCDLRRGLCQRRIQTADLQDGLTQPPEGVGLRMALELTVPMPPSQPA